jgi:hypothetical protein
LASAEEELSRMTQFRKTEVKALANTLKENQKEFDDQRHSLKLKMGVMEEIHSLRVQELHDKLRKTQESHQEYLTRLMEVLEATLSMREQETAKISAELHAIKAEKDSQILMLEQEVRARTSNRNLIWPQSSLCQLILVGAKRPILLLK